MTPDSASWSPIIPVAHRGSRFLWPENTMNAFSEAWAIGYRHFETDLHLTSDGVLVCFHDRTLDRTTNGSGPLAGHTFDEIRSLDAGFHHRVGTDHPHRNRGITVPSLDELIESFPDVSMVVDLKQDGLEEPLARLIEERGLNDRFIVGSFSDDRLTRFRAASSGQVRTSTGARETRLALAAFRMGRNFSTGAFALQVPVRYWGIPVVVKDLVDSAHNSGMQVHVWTVNTIDEMNRLLDMGVDGLISDRPDLLKKTLEERRQWS